MIEHNQSLFPLVIKDVLTPKSFISVHDELIDNWSLSNFSNANDIHNVSWGQRYTHDRVVFYDAAVTIKLKVLKHVREKIQLIKIHVNGQTALQKSNFHTDFSPEKTWTFVLFTEYNWNTQWGGEFVCQNRGTGEYHYTPYIPNSGVLIPSNWQHYGSSPNAFTDTLRTTVAFSYAEINTLDQMKKESKGLHNLRSLHQFL